MSKNYLTSSTESTQSRWAYRPESWRRREQFAELLGRVCVAHNVKLDWTSDELWTGIMQRDSDQALLDGYVFPLNNAATAKITNNKADTFNILQRSDIPAVPHHLLTPYNTDGSRNTTTKMTMQAIELVGLPLIIKPNADVSGGGGVTKCDTVDEVATTIATLSSHHNTLAASPYIQFDEYRTVVLDDTALLTYQKHRAPGALLHNLGHGASPEILESSLTKQSVEALAITSLHALRGRFASVDTIIDTSGNTMTLEINDGVALGYFSNASTANEEIAFNIYGKAVEASLE